MDLPLKGKGAIVSDGSAGKALAAGGNAGGGGGAVTIPGGSAANQAKEQAEKEFSQKARPTSPIPRMSESSEAVKLPA